MTRAPSKPGAMACYRNVLALALAAGTTVLLSVTEAQAQVQPELFSFPVGLNPNGDNWLALRSLPSASEGTRLAKLGPDTLFTEIRRVGDWVQVRLLSGDIGWVNAQYVGCCRTATVATPGPDLSASPLPASCDDLWYRRNAIFKAAGYCFRSARGISTFGNAGCQYDDEAAVPLSSRQREDVAEIQQEERYHGCQ
jgi:hypothetical protein